MSARSVGIAGAHNYPYEDVQKHCRRRLAKEGYYVNQYGIWYGGYLWDELLHYWLTSYGPVAAGIHASDEFRHYRSGVFDRDSSCHANSEVNHVVMIVGYGQTAQGKKFW